MSIGSRLTVMRFLSAEKPMTAATMPTIPATAATMVTFNEYLVPSAMIHRMAV